MDGHATFDIGQAFWRNPPADLDAWLGRSDILHANNFFCPKGLRTTRLLYTLYDLGFLAHPEWTTEANRLGCFDGVFNASLYADRIIAISEYSRQHFMATFPHYPADRVTVIYPASRFAGRADIPRPESLANVQPNRFWLNVGTLEPRKNHRSLLHAYARLKTRLGTTFPLVLAGGVGWLMDDFEQLLHDLGIQQDVVMLGYVDNRALQWLYQHCFAFIYPSFFEGFGLPVLEAMSLGAAVVASNTTSIPEIVGDAGLLIDPYDDETVSEAMYLLASDQKKHADMKDRALQRAQAFSWDRSAQELLNLYQMLLR